MQNPRTYAEETSVINPSSMAIVFTLSLALKSPPNSLTTPVETVVDSELDEDAATTEGGAVADILRAADVLRVSDAG
jgi:hypothetical protein